MLPVAPEYDQRQTVFSKGMRNRPGLLASVALIVLIPLLAIAYLVVWWFRRRKPAWSLIRATQRVQPALALAILRGNRQR